jgi:hypothetical protein
MLYWAVFQVAGTGNCIPSKVFRALEEAFALPACLPAALAYEDASLSWLPERQPGSAARRAQQPGTSGQAICCLWRRAADRRRSEQATTGGAGSRQPGRDRNQQPQPTASQEGGAQQHGWLIMRRWVGPGGLLFVGALFRPASDLPSKLATHSASASGCLALAVAHAQLAWLHQGKDERRSQDKQNT